MYNNRLGTIYNRTRLSEYIKDVQKNLTNEVDALHVDSHTNRAELIARLVEVYTIAPLKLLEPQASEPREDTRIQKDPYFGEQYNQKVFVVKVRLPFEGDFQLFECTPSTSSIVYPKLDGIGRDAITFTVTLTDLDPAQYQQAVGSILRDINSNIPTINAEVAPWNANLPAFVDELLAKRKGLIDKKNAFMEQIGLKVRPGSSEYVTPSPVTKKVIPKPATETAPKSKEVIAILQDAVYKDIREVLYNAGQSIERKPSLHSGKGEEDIRDMLLLFLETRYDNTAGVGEAFNKAGKTDILLKYAKDGSNIFVAECKFWRGAKSFLAAIDQLLSYLTTRDAKTALLMFVDQQDFNSVVIAANAEVKNHPQFKRATGETYKTSHSYEFALPGDQQSTIQLEVMLFHFPKPSKKAVSKN